MKHKKILFTAFSFLSVTLNAQLRVFQNGNISLGSAAALTDNGIKVRVVGHCYFVVTTAIPLSAALIRG